ncbi:carboxylating nicotinate-nucleotide diphosphorylase [Algimonas porphyrae]|uniref:nicotinate-nucleotide diphosphorylase (carboxylating) n=1 Tax=Algimonas porphyrae TaxID=1128113 RepID=A0ABQ5UWB7_9PROT|nr:carboxylating nicotinate-nucleotide diphosphorylase [Algimonas porphyrae]GLQ19578.1 nicotinate-nucleotide diphosphorylase (carboxylating) [Algimonas porphyrae]
MSHLPPLPSVIIEPIVRRALEEDFGQSGDLSANLLVPASASGSLLMRARDAGVIAGMQAAQLTYRCVDPDIDFIIEAGDGTLVVPGTVVARVEGPSRSLLSAERVALNFLGRMSGIATLTAAYVEAVAGTGTRIAATRKTTPGLRALEKQAVLAGGGYAHRESLAAAIMIKDNHIALAGGIHAALSTVMEARDHMTTVSVEVDTIAQLKIVLPYQPDVVLLDNMDPVTLREAQNIIHSFDTNRLTVEASGGVNLDTVRGIAETGVDIISVGALTHSAPNFDIGMDAA